MSEVLTVPKMFVSSANLSNILIIPVSFTDVNQQQDRAKHGTLRDGTQYHHITWRKWKQASKAFVSEK